ncbi:MAG TPA: LysM peptidoglycan-binding domain-containing protein [Bacteroidia bacterium]|jgi:LysM repeat protein|nr:LysM peptidoglycan-binding domain-containing protein [Bacteroidia bacterium]
MINKKTIHIKLITAFVFCLLSFVAFSQEKSKEIKTIGGKKYYIHKVEKGQSLYAISKIYNIDINVILGENDEAIDGLKNGQELKIPVSGAATTIQPILGSPIDTIRYAYHKVSKKETAYSISKQYNITETQLNQWNPSVATAGIKLGQMLIVGEKKKIIATAPVTIVDTVKPLKPKKNKYNIGLLLPFKLGESESIDANNLAQSKSNFPSVQSLAVDFLMGFNKAADSLKSTDFSIQTFLYDVDDKDSSKLDAVCNSADFKALDLIIGPAYPSGFKDVSAYAKKYNIPVVSPFTQQSKILYKNNIASKVNPSQFTMIESLADYCIDSLKSAASIFIVNNASVKDQQYVKAFKQSYNDHLKELNLPLKDSVIEVRGLAGAKAAHIAGKKNVYVLFSNNQVFLTDFITQLAVFADKKDITLAGWQNVTAQDNIDQDYLNRLSYTFPSQNNLINVRSYANLIKYYQTEMSSDPSDYFFQGFDLGQYYLQNLKTSGPEFVKQLDKIQSEGNYLRFKFYRPDESTGFENKGVYIFKYSNYQLYRTAWK